MTGIIIRIQTRDGTLLITIPADVAGDVSVDIDGERAAITTQNGQVVTVAVPPGQHEKLQVTIGGVTLLTDADSGFEIEAGGELPIVARFIGDPSDESDPPSLAAAPFDADDAARFQAEWAEHLGVDVETTNSIGMTFRLIPPGEFLMGSTEEEAQEYIDEIERLDAVNNYAYDTRITYEKPQHTVRLSRPFALGVHEVTQGQYEAVMEANPSAFSHGGAKSGRVSNVDTSQLPVETMGWIDAIEILQSTGASGKA